MELMKVVKENNEVYNVYLLLERTAAGTSNKDAKKILMDASQRMHWLYCSTPKKELIKEALKRTATKTAASAAKPKKAPAKRIGAER